MAEQIMTEDQRLKRIAELEAKRKKLEIERKKTQTKIREHELLNKILFFGHPDKGYLGGKGKWEPNPLQKKWFTAYANPLYNILIATGGNQIGKTLGETAICLAAIKGYWPWEEHIRHEIGRHLWTARGWKPPIRLRWVGQSWENHIQRVILDKGLKEFWPTTWQVKTKKNNMGVDYFWQDQETGTELQVMSSNQDVKEFEGWTGHLVLYDEPCKRDIWVANSRGLMANHGVSVMGATLLSEPWIYQEIIQRVDENGCPDKRVFHVNADISVNLGFGLDQKGIDDFISLLSPEEKKARIDGIPAFKSGLILQIDRQKHFIDRFDIPCDWMIDILIDYHPSKPQYVLFIATDERNYKYVCFEIVQHGDGKDIADWIIKKVKTYNLRVNRIFADPLSKSGEHNQFMTEYQKIEEGLNNFSFDLESAGELKAMKDDGIIAINSLLQTKNKIPSLFFFRDCKVACQQAEAWMYDENNKPSKHDDDMPENLYRAILLNTEYEPPAPDYYYSNDYVIENKSSVTGY